MADVEELVSKMLAGNRRAVARLMTLVENDIEVAKQVSGHLFPHSGKAWIIAVTGAPGSGKSTLTNQLVHSLIDDGLKVGVLAVDPTSPFSGGAILGDRIRMKDSFTDRNLFIRSMANRGQLGGIARATKDMVTILDAYGCDIIIIETVGVGQSEVDVHEVAHVTLVLLVPGMGDDIQAFKAGIMEICDIFVVNKMDHDGAAKLVMEIESMLDLNEKIQVSHGRHAVDVVRSSEWRVPVQQTNAKTGKGVEALREKIKNHAEFLKESGKIEEKLVNRFKKELVDILAEQFRVHIEDVLDPGVNPSIDSWIQALIARETTPYHVSDDLMRMIGRALDPGDKNR